MHMHCLPSSLIYCVAVRTETHTMLYMVVGCSESKSYHDALYIQLNSTQFQLNVNSNQLNFIVI